ncbi:SAM-dependent methyltransferase, type 18 [Geotalea daltonii FRC-32]|uniref:SAM-dependent methyltransferase, type 18 n=1 Tax=Geotalea daltonii (strain DSM 22248 / JCM 15807 / FRC-32) TaxID=316067 RepID=B9M8Q4_GEODF|nr:class I SAM-dependent methyltransferase [Geotalea daltonii]ACM20400.1 SAM-dependent methyltransferase, type 18 [Geotalea daltonii FRC-32]
MISTDWWNEFFAGPWSQIQAGGYPAERTIAECDLIEVALELEPGARILDIPCGIGRHSVELARRGFQMTGADVKPEYIALAKSSAESAAVAARFLVCDMREFASADRFDAAFCYFGSFGYFTEEDDIRFVRAVAAALKPGGRFLIEGHVAETFLPIYRERDWFWAGSPENRVRVLEERSWNIETSRIETTWTIVGEGGTRSTATSMRIYTYPELRALLASAGFTDMEALDGKTGGPFRLGSPRALIVAGKRAEDPVGGL